MPTRDDYRYVLPIATRWNDNDVYGHVNNVEYYAFFDTVINTWLVREGGLDIQNGPVIAVCAESHCTFKTAVSFPDTVDAALGVVHIGRTSVRYEICVFAEPADAPAAVGWFVHVFVDREHRRPVTIPAALRAALERLLAAPAP